MTPDQPRARLIVPDDLTRAEFAGIARRDGWIPHAVHDAPGETYEQIWANPEATAALHYVEDSALSHERFLVVRSDSVGRRLPEIARAFRTIPVDELCRVIGDGAGVDDVVRALTRLGVVAFEITDQVRDAWVAGLSHPEPAVRLAAIRAISFIASPALVGLLDDTAAEDPDAEVRAHAARLVDLIRRQTASAPRRAPFG